jgi:hypothetical protein
MSAKKSAAPPDEDKGYQEHADEGWWEYGVGGYYWGGTGKLIEPRPSTSQLAAEIEAERYEHLYVTRRWVTPSTWQKLSADQQDDHPGIDNWTWQKYLEWRTSQQGGRAPQMDITSLSDEDDA